MQSMPMQLLLQLLFLQDSLIGCISTHNKCLDNCIFFVVFDKLVQKPAKKLTIFRLMNPIEIMVSEEKRVVVTICTPSVHGKWTSIDQPMKTATLKKNTTYQHKTKLRKPVRARCCFIFLNRYNGLVVTQLSRVITKFLTKSGFIFLILNIEIYEIKQNQFLIKINFDTYNNVSTCNSKTI